MPFRHRLLAAALLAPALVACAPREGDVAGPGDEFARLQAALGPNLLTNGDFTVNAAGWTATNGDANQGV